MYALSGIVGVVMLSTLLLYLFTPMLYPLVVPHYPIHWGKIHFGANDFITTHYTFRFTSLGYDGVKPKVPSSLSGRDFRKIVHKNYLYMGQSDVPQMSCQSVFYGILSFAHVASLKVSKRGSNAVRMRL
jgi:hypothetical protein